MDSRRARAVGERDRLIRDVVANTKVFQGGGSEVLLTALDDRIKAATHASLVRMFPRFKDADSAAWEAVIKRAREGADHPFQPTGHTDATEKHAVCQQVIATIGAGKSGSDVRKALGGSPFGWPRDAVDAALIALHRLQHITATLNGQAVPAGQLDQNKIAKAEFRVEHATLSVGDRLILRKLFQALGVPCKSGEEATRAGEFLSGLIVLAKAAGGEAPVPAAPSTTEIKDIQRLVGNEQLVAIKTKATEWENRIKAWSATRDLMPVDDGIRSGMVSKSMRSVLTGHARRVLRRPLENAHQARAKENQDSNSKPDEAGAFLAFEGCKAAFVKQPPVLKPLLNER